MINQFLDCMALYLWDIISFWKSDRLGFFASQYCIFFWDFWSMMCNAFTVTGIIYLHLLMDKTVLNCKLLVFTGVSDCRWWRMHGKRIVLICYNVLFSGLNIGHVCTFHCVNKVLCQEVGLCSKFQVWILDSIKTYFKKVLLLCISDNTLSF